MQNARGAVNRPNLRILLKHPAVWAPLARELRNIAVFVSLSLILVCGLEWIVSRRSPLEALAEIWIGIAAVVLIWMRSIWITICGVLDEEFGKL